MNYTYSNLITALEQDQVREIRAQRSSEANDFGTATARLTNGETIRVNIPSVSVLQQRLDDKAAQSNDLKFLYQICQNKYFDGNIAIFNYDDYYGNYIYCYISKMQGGSGGKMMSFKQKQSKKCL